MAFDRSAPPEGLPWLQGQETDTVLAGAPASDYKAVVRTLEDAAELLDHGLRFELGRW